MPQQYKTALEAMKAALTSAKEWEDEPYDGICGKLPTWMPAIFVEKFLELRYKLLVREAYPLSKIRMYVRVFAERLMDGSSGGVTPIPGAILKDISWLCLVKEAVDAGSGEGLKMLMGERTAKNIRIGKKTSEVQTVRARKKRGQLDDSDETLNDVIKRVGKHYPHLPPNEIWVHFVAELESLGYNPEEIVHRSDRSKTTVIYDFRDGRKPITFGRFYAVMLSLRK